MCADKIKVAFIGTGRISTLHQLYYDTSDDAELYAICEKNKKLATRRAGEWGIKKENVYHDIDTMLKDKKIDAVEVLTRHSDHRDHVVKACEAGKHVSVQKVPCMSLSEFDEMRAAAMKAGVKLKVFENFQFHAPYVRTLDLIKSGEIGKVMAVNYRMWSTIRALENWKVPLQAWKWRYTEKNNFKMPTLFDDGYHKHNVIQMFLGKKIRSVQAWNKGYRIFKLVKLDVPAVVSYKTRGIEYGVWNTSMGSKLPITSDYYGCDEAVEIQCDRGIIWVNGCTGNMFVNDACGVGRPGVHWINEKGEWIYERNLDTNWKHSFMACTKDFIESINEDREPYRSGDEARHILQVDLAMVASIRTGFSDFKVSNIKDGLPENLVEGEDAPEEEGEEEKEQEDTSESVNGN
ncbi:MAG: Gfo/Idh/MocA family protein [Promethearchaeota archaeon]